MERPLRVVAPCPAPGKPHTPARSTEVSRFKPACFSSLCVMQAPSSFGCGTRSLSDLRQIWVLSALKARKLLGFKRIYPFFGIILETSVERAGVCGFPGAGQFAPCIASRWEQSNPDNLPRARHTMVVTPFTGERNSPMKQKTSEGARNLLVPFGYEISGLTPC